MDPVTSSAVIQGAGNALSTATDMFTWRQKMKKSFDYQKQLAQLQQQLSRQNYDYEQSDKRNWNEYGEMLGKLSDVGMNPLYFSGDLQGAGNASLGDASIPSAPSAQGSSFEVPDFLSANLTKREQDIARKRMLKQNEESDSNIKKNLAEFENLLKVGKRTEQETSNLEKTGRAIEQGLDIRAQELKLSWDTLSLERCKYWLSEDAFRWQKQMDERRLGVDYINARTQQYNASTARKQFMHMLQKDSKEFEVAVAEAKARMKSMGINDFLKYLQSFEVKSSIATIPGRLLHHILGPGIALTESLKSNPKMSDDEKLKVMQEADRLFDEYDLMKVEIPEMPTKLYFDNNGHFTPPKWTPPSLR